MGEYHDNYYLQGEIDGWEITDHHEKLNSSPVNRSDLTSLNDDNSICSLQFQLSIIDLKREKKLVLKSSQSKSKLSTGTKKEGNGGRNWKERIKKQAWRWEQSWRIEIPYSYYVQGTRSIKEDKTVPARSLLWYYNQLILLFFMGSTTWDGGEREQLSSDRIRDTSY
jgi:hypothetical protein